MTGIVHMPRSAWLYHFRKARAAGNRSREAAARAAQRLQSETTRAAEAPSELRKAKASFQISKEQEHNAPPNPKTVTPRKRRW